jgi:hypothetical protein
MKKKEKIKRLKERIAKLEEHNKCLGEAYQREVGNDYVGFIHPDPKDLPEAKEGIGFRSGNHYYRASRTEKTE